MLNKQTTIGRLTADPELKSTQDGTSVCTFTVASDDDIKGKDTDFVYCVAWRRTAEIVAQYGHTGELIYVEGRPKKHSWIDKKDLQQVQVELHVDRVYLIGGRKPDAEKPAQAPKQQPIADDDLPF